MGEVEQTLIYVGFLGLLPLSAQTKLLAVLRVQVPSRQQIRESVFLPLMSCILTWHSHHACRNTNSLRQACRNGSLALPVCTTTTELRLSQSMTAFLPAWISPALSGQLSGSTFPGRLCVFPGPEYSGECGVKIFPPTPTSSACEAGVTCNDAVWFRPESVRNYGYPIVKGEKF